MRTQSQFWSRSYTVIRQRVRLNLYFGEAKVSEFNQLVEEAKSDNFLNLTPSIIPDTIGMSSFFNPSE